MLGQLSGEDQAHGGLDLADGHRRLKLREASVMRNRARNPVSASATHLLVVAGQAGSLHGDLLEDVVDERVPARAYTGLSALMLGSHSREVGLARRGRQGRT